jgi:hypothetical protein
MDKLERERFERVRKVSERDGIREGQYKLRHEGGAFTWVALDLVFYPRETWFVTDLDGTLVGNKIPGTRRKLTDDVKARLEDWL